MAATKPAGRTDGRTDMCECKSTGNKHPWMHWSWGSRSIRIKCQNPILNCCEATENNCNRQRQQQWDSQTNQSRHFGGISEHNEEWMIIWAHRQPDWLVATLNDCSLLGPFSWFFSKKKFTQKHVDKQKTKKEKPWWTTNYGCGKQEKQAGRCWHYSSWLQPQNWLLLPASGEWRSPVVPQINSFGYFRTTRKEASVKEKNSKLRGYFPLLKRILGQLQTDIVSRTGFCCNSETGLSFSLFLLHEHSHTESRCTITSFWCRQKEMPAFLVDITTTKRASEKQTTTTTVL